MELCPADQVTNVLSKVNLEGLNMGLKVWGGIYKKSIFILYGLMIQDMLLKKLKLVFSKMSEDSVQHILSLNLRIMFSQSEQQLKGEFSSTTDISSP